MTVSLRPATADDQPRVGELHHRSRAAAYADLLDDPRSFAARGPEMFVAWWVERWQWEQDTHRMTLAEDDGELIGFSYIGPSETPGAAELYAIHLDPARVGDRGLVEERVAPALGAADLRDAVLDDGHVDELRGVDHDGGALGRGLRLLADPAVTA